MFQGGASFVDHVISVLFLLWFRAHLFIDVLWSPDGKGADLMALVSDV